MATDILRHTFVVGLRDAHAVEHQALALMDRQLDHLENYPEVAEALRRHRGETEGQITRLETILGDLGETHSGLKDAALSLSGNLAAIAHLPAADEILKNSFANQAFENFEAAAYTSLVTLAQDGFSSAVPLLQQSLDEETRMAELVNKMIPVVTRKYISLRQAGETASH